MNRRRHCADDARRFCALLTNSPPDLKALREVYDSMGRFQAGLDKMSGSLKMQRLDAVRDGIHGLERSLSAVAEEVERLSKYSSPVVVSTGMRPGRPATAVLARRKQDR